MTEECSKYGTVAGIEIPHVGGAGAGVGFVFVKFHTREDAQKVLFCNDEQPAVHVCIGVYIHTSSKYMYAHVICDMRSVDKKIYNIFVFRFPVGGVVSLG